MSWGRPQIGGIYDWATFTLNTGTTDYNVKTNQALLFLNVPIARNAFIWSTQDISFKFNRTSLPAIAFAAVSNGESPYEGRDMLLISNIFLTNSSGTNATIKILLTV